MQLMPVLPLRDVVIFPHMAIQLFVGRPKSIRALEVAMESSGKQVLLAAQKDAAQDDPGADGIYTVGTVSSILQMLKMPDGHVKVLVEGDNRVSVSSYRETGNHYVAKVSPFEAVPMKSTRIAQQLTRLALAEFGNYIKLNTKISPEIMNTLADMEDPGRLADTIAAHLSLKLREKQEILENRNLASRIRQVLRLMKTESELLQVDRRIRGRVKGQMEKSQREYYLNEQMKAIQKELGDEEGVNEIEEMSSKITKSGMPKEAREKAEAELKKLKMMSPMSAEATVVRNYIDWLVSVPWKVRTRIRKDLEAANKVLDEDHYGLEKIKERILEYLAVQQRVKKIKGPILCLVGPPGVGKTSLGRSIARATNRKFTRMSLGGVRDEAEIRGHRRTYIGSLPGKIVSNLVRVKARNPLFMLDEVDKMTMDFRGDPSAALLEVLDPEQNNVFNDHYLEVDCDLSEVMFVATANTLNIPPPLLDRMEIIRLSGYTEDEKLNIAIRYLVPRQIKDNGLKDSEITIGKGVLLDIVRYYTLEAGVRNLEREISNICRKIAKELLLNKRKKQVNITSRNLARYLGVRRHRFGMAEAVNQVGQATGLAWTWTGGELLGIEAVVMPGRGKHLFTGKLGNVMQESIQAAASVVRSRTGAYGLDPDFYRNCDIHVHVPEGATPKDGPSAGIAMCTAIVSALTNNPVRADVAMTGEITLRGEVLAIGGLKEKLLAANRGGIRTVLIPEQNKKELVEIPDNIKEGLDIIPVKWIDRVLKVALEAPLRATKSGARKSQGDKTPPPAARTEDITAH